MSIRTPERVPQIPHHLSLPDFKGGLRWARKNWKPVGSISLAVAALGSGVLLWIAHDRGPQTSATPTKVSDTFNPPKDESGIALVPLATSTPEVTPKPPATSTTETKKETPFSIIPEQYLSKAELVEVKAANGLVSYVIYLNLPPGVPISPDRDGQASKAKTDYGLLAVIQDRDDPALPTFSVEGDIQFKNMFTEEVKKGDVLAVTQNTGVVFPTGQYNVGISITRTQEGKQVDDLNKLGELFPEAVKNGPVKTVEISNSGSSKTIYTTPIYK